MPITLSQEKIRTEFGCCGDYDNCQHSCTSKGIYLEACRQREKLYKRLDNRNNMTANSTQIAGTHYKKKTIEIDCEEWKSIPGWDGYYEASSLGMIRSVRRILSRPHPKNPLLIRDRAYGGKILSPKIGSGGYPAVSLWKNNRGVTIEVHRLVCSAFTGLMPNGLDVNHINGCRTDNRSINLEWVTRKENLMHSEIFLGKKMVWTQQKERALQRRMCK